MAEAAAGVQAGTIISRLRARAEAEEWLIVVESDFMVIVAATAQNSLVWLALITGSKHELLDSVPGAVRSENLAPVDHYAELLLVLLNTEGCLLQLLEDVSSLFDVEEFAEANLTVLIFEARVVNKEVTAAHLLSSDSLHWHAAELQDTLDTNVEVACAVGASPTRNRLCLVEFSHARRAEIVVGEHFHGLTLLVAAIALPARLLSVGLHVMLVHHRGHGVCEPLHADEHTFAAEVVLAL